MTDIKTNLRRHALEKRDLVTPHEAHEAAAAIRAAGLALVEALSKGEKPVVSVYWPIRSEINTRLLIDALCDRGVAVALPVMSAVREPLVFRSFSPGDDLAKGPFGLSEPSADKPGVDPAIVFAPLAAFDRKGFRMGYGGGIYDATFASLRKRRSVTAVGLAYAVQEADAIPIEPHDQKLDYIITERETIRCC
ncbi:5-formyltetrahydrofolate cyclo-ligase [Methylocystis heyeri]|uniref:5-formyltetrahydrofolate cyclo-ligase n=1 Tax=Methylocystis heyeri TaxID=391905 RepID=A0A6B8KFF8_9HYPH|nr:5-formyltetrahydrofolate cyclo-ligase [Methylocystis heyeri]QGM46312.1 5-formyltetrahydrofolate cyclo-ligase [Methylocystis heyeri]